MPVSSCALRPPRHSASAARKLALGRCDSLVFALALGCPHASVWPWPSNMVAAPPACDLGTSGSTFSNRVCDAHRLSRVNVRAHPSCEPTHLCVPAARTDAALRRFARRRSPGRRRFSPTGCPRPTTDLRILGEGTSQNRSHPQDPESYSRR